MERPELFTRREVCALLRITKDTLLVLERDVPGFPRRVPIGLRKYGWFSAEIMEWLRARQAGWRPPDWHDRFALLLKERPRAQR